MPCRGAGPAGLLYQLGVFFLIAGFVLVLNVAQRGWSNLELKLREGLVLGLLHDWMLRAARFGWPCGNDGRSTRTNASMKTHANSAACRPISGRIAAGLDMFFTFGACLGPFERLHLRVSDRD